MRISFWFAAGVWLLALPGAPVKAGPLSAMNPPSATLVDWDDEGGWGGRGAPDEDWEPRRPGGGGCAQARGRLDQANAALNIARYNLTALDRLCGGGDMYCVAGYQNVYNQAVSGVRRAQRAVRFRCGY